MAELRDEERWVASVIEAALPGAVVKQHDDGSRPGMHDLGIHYPDGSTAAVGVTRVADPDAMEIWPLLIPPGGYWSVDGVVASWSVAISTQAKVKRIRQELPALLAAIEDENVDQLDVRHDWLPTPRHKQAAELGIENVYRIEGGRPGAVYPTIALPFEQTTGWVPDNSNALPEWLPGWIGDPARVDNLQKLARSGTPERHLAIIFSAFTGAPFAVSDLLMRSNAPVPTIAPDLPEQVRHVWVMSSWNSPDGFRWSPDHGWSRFDKHLDNPA